MDDSLRKISPQMMIFFNWFAIFKNFFFYLVFNSTKWIRIIIRILLKNYWKTTLKIALKFEFFYYCFENRKRKVKTIKSKRSKMQDLQKWWRLLLGVTAWMTIFDSFSSSINYLKRAFSGFYLHLKVSKPNSWLPTY